mgnify:CR=1 FL=1
MTGLGRYAKLCITTLMHRSQLCIDCLQDRRRPDVTADFGPAHSLHNYSVCKNRIKESEARNCRTFVSGASSRPSAVCFISRSAST